MRRSYVIHTGNRDDDFRILGPFASKDAARRSPFARLPGAVILPLLGPRATLPDGIDSSDTASGRAERGHR